MSKRRKFILTSIALSLGMFFVQEVDVLYRYWAIIGISAVSVLLSIWSLSEALSGVSWFTTIILPGFFTGAVGLFYFLLPQTFISQLPIAILYGVGMYALLLTENIFSVAAIRTIQLFRAAQAVGFILSLLTAFLIYDTIFSFRLSYWQNSLLIMVFSFPLFIQGLWSINLDKTISKKVFRYSMVSIFTLAEIVFVLSFWPLTITIRALALTTAAYVLLGILQADLQDRLFRQAVWEYIGVGIVVLTILVFTTRWG